MAMAKTVVAGVASAFALAVAQSALAGSHTWDISEVFSTPDGSIQFIELWEANGTPGEINLAGLQVKSQSTGNTFTFTSNLVPPSSNKRLLLATASFAALPGAPTPNGIIVPNFFNQNGDTITYHIYDSMVFGPIPTDCINSLSDPGAVVGPNSPTNYLGETGSVDACPKAPCPADLNGSGSVDVTDLLSMIGVWGACADPDNCPADLSGDDTVNVTDLLALIGQWGVCP